MLQCIFNSVLSLTSSTSNKSIDFESVKIGKDTYSIQVPIGTGCYSSVFRATNGEGKVVAVKQYLEKATKEDVRQEVEMLKRISLISGVSKYIDYFENVDGVRHLVTELIEGNDLFTFLETQSMSRRESYTIFKEVVRTVRDVHVLHIVHRDIKAENIMIERETGKVYLIDWGFAEREPVLIPTSKGSIHYTAPEVLYFPPMIGVYNDVWSLGVLLYVLLTFHMPYPEAPNDKATIMHVISRNINLGVPRLTELDRSILKKIFIEYNERITAKELYELLDKIDLAKIDEPCFRGNNSPTKKKSRTM